jgi:hypothetical protein
LASIVASRILARTTFSSTKVLGPNYHHGADCDARAGIEELAARITFTRRVFRDYYKHADGFVSIIAPVVEER